jgi:hypothetical protein
MTAIIRAITISPGIAIAIDSPIGWRARAKFVAIHCTEQYQSFIFTMIGRMTWVPSAACFQGVVTHRTFFGHPFPDAMGVVREHPQNWVAVVG